MMNELSQTEPLQRTVNRILDRQDQTKDPECSLRRLHEFAMMGPISGAAGPADRLCAYWPGKQITGKLFGHPDLLPNGGFKSLVQRLQSNVDIVLGQKVSSIVDGGDGIIRVACIDGAHYRASHVVVTVPLGVLKASTIAFEPLLSPEKVQGLAHLEMGFFEKVILVFERRFWDARFNSNLAGYVGKSGDRPFPSWFEVSDKAGAPTFVCLYDGLFARKVQIEEGWSDDVIVSEARKALAACLGLDLLPPHAASYCTHWARDPLALGCYSYTPLGSTPSDFDDLAAPEWNGRLLFAGEHTSSNYNATVHGALLSGLREADRLLTSMGKK
jgi:polyamine oxidase